MRQVIITLYLGSLTTLGYTQNVGIGQPAPGSKLSVSGNMSIGQTFSTLPALTNGLIVEGNTGIGTPTPVYKLDVYAQLDWGGLRVRGPQNTQALIEAPSNESAYLCWVQNGLKRFCMKLDPSGNYLRIERYDNAGVLMSDSALVIRRSDGAVGLGITPSTYKLELPNVAGPGGQAIANQWLVYSDSTLKTNIAPLDSQWALQTILKLQPVHYIHHSSYFSGNKLIVDTTSGEPRYGFIAQEVAQHVPTAVKKSPNTGIYAVDYTQLLTVYVAALQAQQQYIDSLEKQIQKLSLLLEQLKNRYSDEADN